ncbi:hypothetical protein EKO04_000903 [Ascochyta lentis]|uniref:DUF6536 domain-containing protein n=1 Tax=Ascochyta lentis TaxID=205686 RepID=A0A8H7MMW8_9PLEO|nr:hypothetical protein EKO04_000903 [Ascochyta lentis]
MASHTDQQPQNGSHLPAIDEVSLQEMILEATDTLIPLDVFRRSPSPVDHNHLNNRLDAEQGYTREVLGRETESNEHEALLGERPSRICSVCRGRNSTEPVPTETDVAESGSSDFEDSAELRRPTLFGHRLHKPLKIVQATQQHITNRTRQSRFHGWRMGVLSGCCMSTLVLGCNIALVVVGANRYGGYDNSGIADLMYGDELTISRWNTALHIFINILSSILLAGSNYTMQVLSSPTRQEIDRAHGRGDWLEVGILSLRNLRRISRNRALLCLVLATSSIPLHLFYNASTFKIIAHNDYYVRALDIKSTAYLTMNSSTAYQNLSNEGWQSVYNRPFVSGHGNLYLVADWMAFNTTTNLDPLWLTPSMFLPWEARNVTKYNSLTVSALLNGSTGPDWIPYDDGQPNFSLQNATFKSTYNETIRPNLLHIAHAFSTPTNSQSRIQISFHFMMVVIAFNVFKLVVMMSVLITDRRKYIVTLGDASASFLEFPEPLTESCCLLSRDQIIHQAQKQSSNYGRLPKTEQMIIADSRHGWQPQLKSYYFSSTRVDRGLLALLS